MCRSAFISTCVCICVFTGKFSCSVRPQHAISVHHIWASDPSEGPGQVSGGFPAALQCQRGPEFHPGASFSQDHDALQSSRPTQRPAQDRWHWLFCLPVCTGTCLFAYLSPVETGNEWNEFLCHCTSVYCTQTDYVFWPDVLCRSCWFTKLW